MTCLQALATELGFRRAATYIQSGNLLFEASVGEKTVKAKLDQALATELGKPCGAMVRTAEELAAVVAKNPFKKVEPTRVVVFFLDEAREAAAMGSVKTPGKEDLGLVGARSDGEGDGGLRA